MVDMPAQPPDGAIPPQTRRRLGLRSLTARLVFGVVALVIVLVGVIGATTYIALRQFLYERLDQQVSTATAQYVDFVNNCARQPSESSTCTNTSTVHEWVAVIDPTGRFSIRLVGPNVSTLNLTTAQRTKFLSQTSPTFETITADGFELRITQRFSPALGLLIVTGLSTDELNRTLGRLLTIELIIGGAAVALALAATTIGVQRSLRRLYRVTATAQEVAAELSPEGYGLDRRVPFANDGTEVGQLAESMNTLLSAVETQFAARLESEHRMRQFLADASHELRTPLTSIRGYAELARMRGGNEDEASDELARIESEGTRMSRLVDDLLVLARSDQQDTTPERHLIDVTEVLDDVVEGARAAFPERSISLSASPGLSVIGDTDQILRVVRNLVTNAATHTRPDGPINVSAGEEGHHVVVRIVDGGPGLPPEQAQHVFERFWRADRARSRARGGSGLGMAIVASLVRANGGAVRFDSDVERGSTVTVWLPGANGSAS